MSGQFQRLSRQAVSILKGILNLKGTVSDLDMKFILLHDGKNEDSGGIKNFFMELWELYVKVQFLRVAFLHVLNAVPIRLR